MVDNYNLIIDSYSNIDRAMLDANSPLIFNNEESLNQIKKEEIPIKQTDNEYYVLYLNRGATAEGDEPRPETRVDAKVQELSNVIEVDSIWD